MKSILLGTDAEDGQKVRIPTEAFRTHMHLIGGTGKGKTTALHTMLQRLMLDPTQKPAVFLFDRLGNYSDELLLWIASPFCTDDVRNRLVYIEPAREDVVLPFNPLMYDTPAHGYYKVARTTDIVLRAWESVNIEAMPRLARWVFNSFWAMAQLGLTVADSVHLLMPGSPYHARLLTILPERLRYEWDELVRSRSSEVLRTLDSSRNRLKPYYDCDILRRMFGTAESRLDVEQFMREGKIVLLNLAPRNRLSMQLSDAIGGLVLNEVLATARSLPRTVRYPTYLVLDEFQNFVGPDIESALPEVRQLGLRLMLSHQSLSQLQRGEHDLTNMIFQAQSRLVFGVQGEDAEELAHEVASIDYDPKRVKEELYTRRQLVTGHRVIELSSTSEGETRASQWSRDYGTSWSNNASTARKLGPHGALIQSDGTTSGNSSSRGEGESASSSHTHGTHESLLPVYEQFLELSNQTYYSFDEQKHLWAQKIRNLPVGMALLRLVDDSKLREVRVKQSTPGYLGWDFERIAKHLPQVLEQFEQLIERNFDSDLFRSPEVVDRESEARLQAILRPKLITGDDITFPHDQSDEDEPPAPDPFT